MLWTGLWAISLLGGLLESISTCHLILFLLAEMDVRCRAYPPSAWDFLTQFSHRVPKRTVTSTRIGLSLSRALPQRPCWLARAFAGTIRSSRNLATAQSEWICCWIIGMSYDQKSLSCHWEGVQLYSESSILWYTSLVVELGLRLRYTWKDFLLEGEDSSRS